MSRHRIKVAAMKGTCPVHQLGDALEIHDGYRLERSTSKGLCLIALDTIRTQLAQKAVPESFACTKSCTFARGGAITLEVQRVDPTDRHFALPFALQQALQERSLSVYRSGALDRVLQPSPATERNVTQTYDLLKQYAFRAFLQDLLKAGPACRPEGLTATVSLPTVQRYLKQLVSLGIVTEDSGVFTLVNPSIDSVDTTLEWFIATAMQREFGAEAAWNVRMQKSGKGGDFDCLALLDRRVLAVEMNAAQPKAIHQPEITSFVERIGRLQPTASILIVDTQLGLDAKMTKMIAWALRHLRGEGDWKAVAQPGYFVVPAARLYLINGKPDVLSNLTVCLKAIASVKDGAPTP